MAIQRAVTGLTAANPASPTLYMSASTAVGFLGSITAFPGYNGYRPGSAMPFGGPQNFGTVGRTSAG